MVRLKSRCNSCARLKIACDQGKPKCEYCTATNRNCVYEPAKKRGRKPASITKESSKLSPKTSTETSTISSTVASTTTFEPQFIHCQPLAADGSDIPNDLFFDLNELTLEPYANPSTQTALVATDDILWSGGSEEIEEINTPKHKPIDGQLPMVTDEFIYDQMPLNSVQQQLQISRFEHRLLDYFNQSIYQDALARCGSVDNFSPAEIIWGFELPYLWQRSLNVRKNIYSLVSLALRPRVDLYTVLVEDLKKDSIDEYLGTYNIPLLTGTDTINEFFHSEDPKKHLQLSEFETKSMEYFSQALLETHQTFLSLADGTIELDSDTGFEIQITAELVYSFLLLQPFRLVPLIDFSRKQPDLIQFIKSIVSSYDVLSQTLINSPYSGALYLYEKVANDPETDESFPIIDQIISDIDEFKKEQFDPIINQDSIGASEEDYEKMYDAARWLKRCLMGARATKQASCLFVWFYHIDFRLLDLMYQEHYICLKLFYYCSKIAMEYGFHFDKNNNIWLDYINWFNLYEQGRTPVKHQTENDTAYYEVINDRGSDISDVN